MRIILNKLETFYWLSAQLQLKFIWGFCLSVCLQINYIVESNKQTTVHSCIDKRLLTNILVFIELMQKKSLKCYSFRDFV